MTDSAQDRPQTLDAQREQVQATAQAAGYMVTNPDGRTLGELIAAGEINAVVTDEPVTVKQGMIIRISPERGPERTMIVAHVEHHIITLADLPANEEADQ